MPINITHWIESSLTAAHHSLYFMLWNTFLAVIPFIVSRWIFRGRGSGVRGISWWVGLVIFVAFLPNAPYVLTDIIHLVNMIKANTAIWTITFVLIPQYFVFMMVGTEAYVLSLINMGHYLRKQGRQRWIPAAELTLHALCAIGIFLGRFPRFNSWDMLTEPGRVIAYLGQALITPQSLAVMIVTFMGIAAIYWPLKHLSLAMALYVRSPEYRHAVGAVCTSSRRSSI